MIGSRTWLEAFTGYMLSTVMLKRYVESTYQVRTVVYEMHGGIVGMMMPWKSRSARSRTVLSGQQSSIVSAPVSTVGVFERTEGKMLNYGP